MTKKAGAGDTTSIKGSELNSELNNSEATAKNDNPIWVTFVNSKRQYTINSNGTIEYVGEKKDTDINIQYSIEDGQNQKNIHFTFPDEKMSNDEQIEFLANYYGKDLKSEKEYINNLVGKSFEEVLDRYLLEHGYEIEGLNENEKVSLLSEDLKITTEQVKNDLCYASIEEVLEREMLYAGIDESELYRDVTTTLSVGGVDINSSEDDKNSYVVTWDGNYTVVATNDKGNTGTLVIQISGIYEEKFSEIKTIDTEYSSDGKIAIIPKGFAVGNTENINSIDSGLVITDAVDNDGYSIGNEFVWIPINKNTLCPEGVRDKPMAELITGTENYKGILYKFKSNTLVSTKMENSSNAEPIFLDNSEKADASSYNTINLTQQSLQDEYNEIINSIKANGGFYVGRYKTSIDIKQIVQSKQVLVNLKRNWYDLYTLQKSYTNKNNNNIKTTMITGACYDAMLNWALIGDDAELVNKDQPWKEGERSIQINNIKHMANSWIDDLTTEGDTTNFVRIMRGKSAMYACYASYRYSNYPVDGTSPNAGIGSRMLMYIKAE